jgi:hypothetical protein
MDDRERALNLVHEGLKEASAVVKLQFGVSTGAVALFVHAIFERHEGPVLVGILSVAAICFGASALMCLNALGDLSTVTSSLATAIAARSASTTSTDNDTGVGTQLSKSTKGYGIAIRFFIVGMFSSVALLVAKFVMEVALKFPR